MTRAKNLFVLGIILLLAAAAATAFAFRVVIRDAVAARFKPQLPAPQAYVPQPAAPIGETPSPNARPVPAPDPRPATKPVPPPASKGVNLAVPFTSQAPHADWGMPYQEACEEASMLMAIAYLNGDGAFTPDTATTLLLDLVEWEKNHFGYYEDTTAEEVAEIAREKFGFERSRALAITSISDVKKQLDRGVPVLLPAAGRQLFNPNFTGAGPKYHMLVAKGYTKDGKIITNDPGTRRGADYLYDASVLWNAIHDWNGGDVERGAKVMVIVEK